MQKENLEQAVCVCVCVFREPADNDLALNGAKVGVCACAQVNASDMLAMDARMDTLN